MTELPKMKMELEIADVNFILEALGERPAKTNASTFINKNNPIKNTTHYYSNT